MFPFSEKELKYTNEMLIKMFLHQDAFFNTSHVEVVNLGRNLMF